MFSRSKYQSYFCSLRPQTCLIFRTQLLQYMTHPEVHHLVIEILLITQAVDIRVTDSDPSVRVAFLRDDLVVKKSEIQKHPFLIFLKSRVTDKWNTENGQRKVIAGDVIHKPFNLRTRINCQVIILSSIEYGSASVGEWRNLWHSLNRQFIGKLFVVNVKFSPWGDICGKVMKNRYYKCTNHNLLIFQFLSEQYNLTLVSAFEKVGNMEMLQRPDPGRMGAIITLAISHLIASDGLTSGTDLGISSLISDPPKVFANCLERDRKKWGTALKLNLLTPFVAVTWALVL